MATSRRVLAWGFDHCGLAFRFDGSATPTPHESPRCRRHGTIATPPATVVATDKMICVYNQPAGPNQNSTMTYAKSHLEDA